MKQKLTLASMMIVANTMILISLTSCSKKNTDVTPIHKSTSKEMISKEKLTENELIQQGYRLVESIDLTTGLPISTTVHSENTNNEIARYPLTAKHLKILGYDLDNPNQRADLQSKLSYNKYIAESIYFNDNFKWNWYGNHFPSGTPNASILVTAPVLEVIENTNAMPDETFMQEVYNQSNEESEIDAAYSYKKGCRVSWQKSQSTSSGFGFSVETKINVTPLYSAGANFNTNIVIGSTTVTGGDTTSETTLQSIHKARVPAKSMKRIVILTYKKLCTFKYIASFEVDGWIHTKHLVPYTINNWQFSGITFHKTIGYGQYLGGNNRNIFNPKNETGYIYETINTTVKVYESASLPINELNNDLHNVNPQMK